MNTPAESSTLDNSPQETRIPFFNDESSDEDSLVTDSSTVSNSSRWDSLLEKGIGVFRKPASQEQAAKVNLVALRNSMHAWNAHKPSTKNDSLPYNDVLVANDPFMNLTPYKISCEDSYSNLIALLTNSVRREIADMNVFILPGVLERSTAALSRGECLDLQSWWKGFAEYLFCVLSTVATALEMQNSEAAGDISRLVNFKRRDITREYKRCIERLTVTSEIPMKEMNKKMHKLLEAPSACRVVDVDDMWSCISSFVLQTLDDSFNVAKFTEFTSKKKLSAGKQEKILRGMLAPPRGIKSKEASDYHANIIISLTRWMRDEVAVVKFTEKFFKMKFVRKLDVFVTLYAKRRGIFEFQFDRRPETEPQRKPHNPSRVTFSLPE